MDSFREPIFDDIQLAQIEEQQNEQLVNDLVGCIIDLGKMVATLRVEVNCLARQLNPNAPPAYYEPYSTFVNRLKIIPLILVSRNNCRG